MRRRRRRRAPRPGSSARARCRRTRAARASRPRTRSRRAPRRARSARAARPSRRSRRTADGAPSGRRARPRRRARAASPPRSRRCRRPAAPSGRSGRRSRAPLSTAAASEANGGQRTTSTPVGRLEAVEERTCLGRPLEHLPVAGDQHQPEFSGIAATPGKLLALEQLERGAAAGRDPGDLVGEPELVDRADGVAAADDRVAVDGRRPPRRPPSSRRRTAPTRTRPSARSRRPSSPRGSAARSPRATRARCRARASPPGARRTAPPASPRLRRTRWRRRRRSAARPGTASGFSSRSSSAIFPPTSTSSARAAEVLQHAELVLDLGAAGDEDERPLDVAEQPAEVLELGQQEQPGVGGQESERRRRWRRARGAPSRRRR